MTAATSDVRTTSPVAALAAAGMVVAGVIIFAGNYNVRKGDSGGTGAAIGTAIICVVLAVALFGFVVPRARNTNRTAFILGLIGFVSIVAFWSGVTPVLAAAAVAVAPPAAQPDRRAKVAQGLAVAAALVALVVTLAQSHLF
jgi:hypothetical protein